MKNTVEAGLFQSMMLEASRIIQNNQNELDTLKSENCVVSSSSRTIIHDDNYIYLYVNGHEDYISYDSAIYAFLCDRSECTYKVNTGGRTQIELSRYTHEGKRFSPMLAGFLYGYYNMGLPLDEYINQAKEITERKSKEAYTIDHTNSDTSNNTVWNLGSMSRSLNSRKNNLASRIKPPYFLYPIIMPDGSYRAKFGYVRPYGNNALIGQKWYTSIPNAYALCDFLKWFMEVEVPTVMNDYGTPQEVYIADKTALAFSGCFEAAAAAYQELISLEKAGFFQ